MLAAQRSRVCARAGAGGGWGRSALTWQRKSTDTESKFVSVPSSARMALRQHCGSEGIGASEVFLRHEPYRQKVFFVWLLFGCCLFCTGSIAAPGFADAVADD